MFRKIFFTFFLLLFGLGVLLFGRTVGEVLSPDGKLRLVLDLNNVGKLSYSVDFQNKPVVLSSLLGLNDWSENLSVDSIIYTSHNETWKTIYGERSEIPDRYNLMSVRFRKKNEIRQKMKIEIRAYDEGVAFRYLFPEHRDGGRDIHLWEELTEFHFEPHTMTWHTPMAQQEYTKLSLNNWQSECERPLVLELENQLYVCLMEAAMVDFSRMKFTLGTNNPNTITTSLYDRVDLTTPFATPWRVIMVAKEPKDLIQNNYIILNLNLPSKILNTSWIKPGKVMREVTLSTSGALELIDFAVKRNIQYIHFDAGWYGFEYAFESDARRVNVDSRRNPVNDLDIEKVVRYADERGIGVFLYVNQRALVQQLDELLPIYKKWGIRGLKFGFVHVGSHRWTTWLHEAVKKCADYNMMVDIHDEYRPTGFSRTWPNLLTQEGILGNEGMPDATHNTIVPFTRFVAGPADYTICYYHRPELKDEIRKSQFPNRGIKTTSAHQLALPVIFYSPLQFMYWYDKPSDSQDEPELEFFDAVPTVWDETSVVHGEIGEYISIARRSGQEWFVGSITNVKERNLTLKFDFLEKDKKYEASIYVDDSEFDTRTNVRINRIEINKETVLNFHLQASGGQTIWIKPLVK